MHGLIWLALACGMSAWIAPKAVQNRKAVTAICVVIAALFGSAAGAQAGARIAFAAGFAEGERIANERLTVQIEGYRNGVKKLKEEQEVNKFPWRNDAAGSLAKSY